MKETSQLEETEFVYIHQSSHPTAELTTPRYPGRLSFEKH